MVFIFIITGTSCVSTSKQNRQQAPQQRQSIPYWFMEVTVEYTTFEGVLFSRENVYFFNSLRDMNNLTGFPRGEFKTSYDWKSITNIYDYMEQIYTQMRLEGFEAAYVLGTSGTNIYGERYWIYNLFYLQNGIRYFDQVTRRNSPVRL